MNLVRVLLLGLEQRRLHDVLARRVQEHVIFYVEKRLFEVVLVVAQEEHRRHDRPVEDGPAIAVVLDLAHVLVSLTNEMLL